LELEGDADILIYVPTFFQDDPGAEKAIFGGGTKYFEQKRNSSKVAFTVVFAAVADGRLLRPYVIYKSPTGCLYQPWVEGGPPDALFSATVSGWMTMDRFNDYFTKVIIGYCDTLPLNDTKIVIGDNLACHLTSHIIDKCEEKNIKFIFLPENSTHLMQPLDVSVFRAMKEKWRQLLRKEQFFMYRYRYKQLVLRGWVVLNTGNGTVPYDTSMNPFDVHF